MTYAGTLEVVSFGAYNVNSQDGTYNLFALNSVTPSGDFSSVTIDGTLLANGSGVWTGTSGPASYTFTEATGDLAIITIPEPATVSLLLGATAMGLLTRRRRHA